MNIGKSLKYLAAGALFALTAYVASAVTIDPNRNAVARVNSTQQTNYYRVTVNFNDPNISAGVHIGRFLQNTFISNVACHVTTAFNAAGVNQLFIGTSTNADNIVSSGQSNRSINEASATYQQIGVAGASSLGLNPTSDADHDLVVRYKQTGTAATAGTATCVIEFVPNNDM